MTAQELKNSILQLAVQGKLVPQDKNDEPASELLKRIQAEKAKLIKEGKIKKEKALPPITEEELPFDIPQSWEWVHLLEVTYQVGNKENQILANEVKAMGKFPAVSQGKNLIDGYCDCEEKVISDLPLIMFGDHTRNVKYVDFPFVISADGTKFLKAISIKDKYLFYWTVLSAEMLRNRGYARHFSLLKQLYLPIPPLAEQQRIVEKIEKLLPLVEEYGKAETRLKELNADFPDMLRKSILQQAVQGKLTERNPEDEPASELLKRIQAEKAQLIKEGKIKKEKALPPIAEEELPFDIPESWEWLRLGDIGAWGSGATPSKSNSAYYNNATIPWLVTGDLNDSIITDIPGKITEKALRETSVKLNPANSVLIAMYGATIGKVGLLSFPATTNQACCACQTFAGINLWYLMYFLMSQRRAFIKRGEGGAQPNISKEKIVVTLIPIPPLEEQKRIVARVEELLALCDQLK